MSFVVVVLFFFFKQKTAYEMRISDWSSDVCSSDLAIAHLRPARHRISAPRLLALPRRRRRGVEGGRHGRLWRRRAIARTAGRGTGVDRRPYRWAALWRRPERPQQFVRHALGAVARAPRNSETASPPERERDRQGRR